MKRNRTVCLLSFLIFCFMLTVLIGQSYSNDNIRNINESVHGFIIQFYEDLTKENTDRINQYFLEKLKKEELDYMIDTSRIYKIDKIEFTETNVLSQRPLIVEAIVKECYKPEVYPPPYRETLFKLEDMGDFNWKIVEITEPGL